MLMARPIIVYLLLALIGACGGGSGSGGGNDDDPNQTDNPASGLQQRPVTADFALPQSRSSGPISMVDAFPDLPDFSQPVYLTNAGDGSNRLFVVEQAGRIQVFSNSPDANGYSTFLDLRDRVISGGEMGLLGLAFDPDFASNGYFYVYYIGAGPRSVVSRFSVSINDPNVADPATETPLLSIDQPYDNHNGGTLQFGPDGYLYFGLGDGGSGGDPDGNGQNTQTLLGSLLRIDPAGTGYNVPADNPFVGSNTSLPEIWAYGFRNPYRFSFDRDTGDLWLADVGQDQIEEINVVTKGGNYGWNWYEGSQVFRGGAPQGDYRMPVYEYDHSLGQSVTGGYVYRGNSAPDLTGQYIYGDFISTRIWSLSVDSQFNVVRNDSLGNAPQNPAGFGEDEQGELYIAGYGGRLYRFESGSGADPIDDFPERLSDTGLFSDTSSLIPASGLIEYAVNAPLWSDYSVKRRWIAIPNGQRITFAANSPWQFPVGSILVKHFAMEMIAGDPDSARHLETRVLIRQWQGWFGVSYRWNQQQTDADLVRTASTETLTVADADFSNGQRQQAYFYPGPNDCLSCHVSAAGVILGVKTTQLNGTFDYAAGGDTRRANQLTTWNHIGLFSSDIGAAGQYLKLAALDDSSASLSQRSRSYLDSNCAFCHQAGGTAPVNIDLRHALSLTQTQTLNQLPQAGDLGITDARIIASGDAQRSVLWARMNRTDNNRMPPIASSMPDQEALTLLQQWIDSL